jgi:hypothetical protein
MGSIFTWMVASQHPLRIGLTQSPAQQFLLLGFFAFRSCLTQSPGWLLRNILFAVA